MGWETLVLSFGSGFRYEMTPNDPYIQTLKTNVAKASAMGIECGGYDLTVLDRGHNGYVSRTIIAGDLGCILPRVPAIIVRTGRRCGRSVGPRRSEDGGALAGRMLRKRLEGQA